MKLNKGNQQRKSTEVKEFAEKINKINKHQASLNKKKMRDDTNYYQKGERGRQYRSHGH